MNVIELLDAALSAGDWGPVRQAYALMTGRDHGGATPAPAPGPAPPPPKVPRPEFKMVNLTCELCRRACEVHPDLVPRRLDSQDEAPKFYCERCDRERRRGR